MSRTLRIIPKNNFAKGWDYPKSRKLCTYCGHRHCSPLAQSEVSGTKSLLKSKGTGIAKRYSKFNPDDLDVGDD